MTQPNEPTAASHIAAAEFTLDKLRDRLKGDVDLQMAAANAHAQLAVAYRLAEIMHTLNDPA